MVPTSLDSESEPFLSACLENMILSLSNSLDSFIDSFDDSNSTKDLKTTSLQDARLFICRIDKTLLRFDQTISGLQLYVTKLKRATSSLRNSRQHLLAIANELVKRRRRAGTNVNLPIEVLQLISSYAYPILGRNRFAELNRDSTWGAIALPQARVWFQCYSFRGHGYERAATLLEDSARAGTKVVTVVDGQSASGSNFQYIDLAVSHAERWSELSLRTLYHYTCNQLFQESRELRRLRRLSITNHHLTCPSIQKLFKRVTYLHVWVKPHIKEMEYDPDWVEVLEGAANLRTISLDFEVYVRPTGLRRSRGTRKMISLPHLRNIVIKQADVSLSELAYIIEDFGVDCGKVESLEFYCLEGAADSSVGVQMEKETENLVRVLDCKFPQLGSLAIAQHNIVCNYERQATVLYQCTIDNDIHGPLFPNLTELTIFLDYTQRGFFSIYNLVIWRLSNLKVKNLRSVKLVGAVTQDDPLEFIGILQSLVSNVTVIKY